MLKLPFIETTYVGMELTEEHLVWVELSKLGNRIDLLGYGQIPRDHGVEQLKEEISSDAFFLGCADNRISKNLQPIDAPFFEEDLELQAWVTTRLAEDSARVDQTVLASHLVSLTEDEHRLFIQQYDGNEVEKLTSTFKDAGYPLVYFSSGKLELGYSQILNPEFVEGYAAVITPGADGFQLLIYLQGQIHAVHELGKDVSGEMMLSTADSILKSVELSVEVPASSISCFYDLDVQEFHNNDRQFEELEAYFHKGKKRLPKSYATAAGVALKLCFPQLDDMDILSEDEKRHAWVKHDKTELIRASILLFAPLVVFLFIAFGVEQWTKPTLNELSQVSSLIGDRLEDLTDERSRVRMLKDEFDGKSLDVEARYIIAPLFETIASSIPDGVWLEEMGTEINSDGFLTRMEGTVSNPEYLTQFIESLQELESTRQVRVLESQNLTTFGIQETIAFTLLMESSK